MFMKLLIKSVSNVKNVLELTGHIRNAYTKPNDCNHCNKKFATMFTLKHHIQMVHGEKMKKMNVMQ